MVDNCKKFLEIDKNYIKKKCNHTRNDDYGCSRIILDEKIIYLNSFFNTIRCLEYSNPNINIVTDSQYNQFREIFVKLYSILYDKNTDMYVILIEFMKELYQRSIYYYSYLNKRVLLGNIRLHSYAKNNDCLIPLLETKNKNDILHFDTHSDHKEFSRFDEYYSLISDPNMDINKIRAETIDIGCFTSYYILYSKTNFIWILPHWCRENKYERSSLKMKRNSKRNDLEYVEVPEKSKDSYIMVQGKLRSIKQQYQDSIGQYYKLVKDLRNNFILSIDLDYFCSNGTLESDLKKMNKEIKKEYLDEADMASYGRTRTKVEFTEPYAYLEFLGGKPESISLDEKDLDLKNNIINNSSDVLKNDTKSVIKPDSSLTAYHDNLMREIKLIVKRLDIFKEFLLFIKNVKKISPSIILISDSANVLLSRDTTHISATNDFCPQNLVLFIRHELIKILKDVYDSKNLLKNIDKYPEFPKIN